MLLICGRLMAGLILIMKMASGCIPAAFAKALGLKAGKSLIPMGALIKQVCFARKPPERQVVCP